MEANYIVIDLRNGNYALGAKSAQTGVDFAVHLGGMRKETARTLADRLNAEGHQPEPEVEPQGRDSAGRFLGKAPEVLADGHQRSPQPGGPPI